MLNTWRSLLLTLSCPLVYFHLYEATGRTLHKNSEAHTTADIGLFQRLWPCQVARSPAHGHVSATIGRVVMKFCSDSSIPRRRILSLVTSRNVPQAGQVFTYPVKYFNLHQMCCHESFSADFHHSRRDVQCPGAFGLFLKRCRRVSHLLLFSDVLQTGTESGTLSCLLDGKNVPSLGIASY